VLTALKAAGQKNQVDKQTQTKVTGDRGRLTNKR